MIASAFQFTNNNIDSIHTRKSTRIDLSNLI